MGFRDYHENETYMDFGWTPKEFPYFSGYTKESVYIGFKCKTCGACSNEDGTFEYLNPNLAVSLIPTLYNYKGSGPYGVPEYLNGIDTKFSVYDDNCNHNSDGVLLEEMEFDTKSITRTGEAGTIYSSLSPYWETTKETVYVMPDISRSLAIDRMTCGRVYAVGGEPGAHWRAKNNKNHPDHCPECAYNSKTGIMCDNYATTSICGVDQIWKVPEGIKMPGKGESVVYKEVGRICTKCGKKMK